MRFALSIFGDLHFHVELGILDIIRCGYPNTLLGNRNRNVGIFPFPFSTP
jgi:hypothetical protein